MVLEHAKLNRVKRTGRRVAIVAFALIVGGATAAWSLEILYAVFAPSVQTVAKECHGGTRDLLRAVERARLAGAAESGDERAALGRFRAALEPEWSTRASLDALCRQDAKERAALIDIDALRYAEEHAVRYEAVGLAPQRRRVQALYEFDSDGQRSPALP